MKLLLHSNGPNVPTGYGVQTAHLAERLHQSGHDVAVSCNYGQQGAIGKWRHDIRLYPVGYETNSNDILHCHAVHFFGEPRGGWIIPLLDVWCLVNPAFAEFDIAAWTPVDHLPVPPDVLKFFQRTDAVPIAMSRFGEHWLRQAGLDPVYIPLSVDTNVYKPTPTITIGERSGTGREMLGLPAEAFVVGMVAMNKGWSRDRKGFNEAFRAFGAFWKQHQDAVLYVHANWPGAAEGINLKELATHAAIPEHAIVFPDQYAYQIGFSAEQMAAVYSSFDVLLAPSHGEGFCVPLIEAQACGVPVIASDFSSQSELAGPEYGAAGRLVIGQLEWDPAQHSSYFCPLIVDVLAALNEAYERGKTPEVTERAIAFAARYDTDKVFQENWLPFLATLEPVDAEPVLREPMDDVAVIVPAMRPENILRLVASFTETNDGSARLHIIHDKGDFRDRLRAEAEFALDEAMGEWTAADDLVIASIGIDKTTSTFAEKVNAGVDNTTESWVLIVGDDVEFKPGWLEAARKLSDRFDVIGTNDSSNGVKNPDVAAGRHADHFFVRRSYIEEQGACLDGPGVLAPEEYRHWYVDREVIELAKARGVFSPCLDSIVEHHHPGYLGREDLRAADPVYMKAVEHSEEDRRTWLSRLPLIQMQRKTRAKVR